MKFMETAGKNGTGFRFDKGWFLISLKIYKRPLPILTLFPLSPLLVNAKELSGNVQRPFGIPLRSKHKQKHRK